MGEHLHDGVQQHPGAQAAYGGAADHREEGKVLHALAQALEHLGVGEILAGEILVHEFLAGLGDGFLQSVVKLVQDGLLVFGDFDLNALGLGADLKGALMEHVDDADDLLVGVPDGGGYGSDILAEALTQGLKGGVVIGVILVGLGDIEQTGELTLFAVFPSLFRPNAHPGLGGADDDRGVGGLKSLHHLAGEVKAARGVQNVDLTAVILHRGDGGGDGGLTADLLGVKVAQGVAVGSVAQTDGAAGDVKHALYEGGLAVARVAQQADVANVLDGIAHVASLLRVQVVVPKTISHYTPKSAV